jgi:Transposase domain (DUF772)
MDMLRSWLNQIIDMLRPFAVLGRTAGWAIIEKEYGVAYSGGPGQPPLATRLMAGTAIIRYMHNLSDDQACERWLENPYYQYFCGEECFQHKLAFDSSSLTRRRRHIGEEKLNALVHKCLAVATKTKAIKSSELLQMVVDPNVQPEAIAFPTDAKLPNRSREILVRLAKKEVVVLRQSYKRVGELALIEHWLMPRPSSSNALEEAHDLSRPRGPRHRAQDQRPRRPDRPLRKAPERTRARVLRQKQVQRGRNIGEHYLPKSSISGVSLTATSKPLARSFRCQPSLARSSEQNESQLSTAVAVNLAQRNRASQGPEAIWKSRWPWSCLR